jgi:hypothetical protein
MTMNVIAAALACQDRQRQDDAQQLRRELHKAQQEINQLREQLEIAKHLGYATEP